MKLTSSAFSDGSIIPKKYGYNYQNVNPPLKIENIPSNTKSLVLIMDDPDALSAVGKIWVHWTLWNIPPNISEIPENSFPVDSVQGVTDFGQIGYGGPAPPDKKHTYFFKLYAINKTLELKSNSLIKDIETQLSDCIIAECVLRGTYAPQ